VNIRSVLLGGALVASLAALDAEVIPVDGGPMPEPEVVLGESDAGLDALQGYDQAAADAAAHVWVATDAARQGEEWIPRVKFYLEATGTPAVSPTLSADWEHSNQAVRWPMNPKAAATTLANLTTTYDAADHIADQDALVVQWISEPLTAQAFPATLARISIRALEANAGNNLFLAWKLFVVDGAGTVGDTLLAIRRDGTELATGTAASRADEVFTSAGVIPEGGRLVLEVGWGGLPVATTGTQDHDGTLRVGSSATQDLPFADASTTDLNPWLELIGASLTLQPPPPLDAEGDQLEEVETDAAPDLQPWLYAVMAAALDNEAIPVDGTVEPPVTGDNPTALDDAELQQAATDPPADTSAATALSAAAEGEYIVASANPVAGTADGAGAAAGTLTAAGTAFDAPDEVAPLLAPFTDAITPSLAAADAEVIPVDGGVVAVVDYPAEDDSAAIALSLAPDWWGESSDADRQASAAPVTGTFAGAATATGTLTSAGTNLIDVGDVEPAYLAPATFPESAALAAAEGEVIPVDGGAMVVIDYPAEDDSPAVALSIVTEWAGWSSDPEPTAGAKAITGTAAGAATASATLTKAGTGFTDDSAEVATSIVAPWAGWSSDPDPTAGAKSATGTAAGAATCSGTLTAAGTNLVDVFEVEPAFIRADLSGAWTAAIVANIDTEQERPSTLAPTFEVEIVVYGTSADRATVYGTSAAHADVLGASASIAALWGASDGRTAGLRGTSDTITDNIYGQDVNS